MHDARGHHRNYPPEWDRHHRSGAGVVQMPAASGHASRSTAAGRPPGGGGAAGGRSSRSNGSRQPSSSRSGGQHGYADVPPNVGPSSNSAGGVGSGSYLGAPIVGGPGSSTSGAGVLSRAQMPLPALPSNAQTQQQQSQQLPQQAYYAPKGVFFFFEN